MLFFFSFLAQRDTWTQHLVFSQGSVHLSPARCLLCVYICRYVFFLRRRFGRLAGGDGRRGRFFYATTPPPLPVHHWHGFYFVYLILFLLLLFSSLLPRLLLASLSGPASVMRVAKSWRSLSYTPFLSLFVASFIDFVFGFSLFFSSDADDSVRLLKSNRRPAASTTGWPVITAT